MLAKFQESKYWLLAILVAIIVTFFITRSMEPAKVERSSVDESILKSENESLKAQVLDLQAITKKLEESNKYSSKEKEYYENGTLKSERELTDESTRKLDESFQKVMQAMSDYSKSNTEAYLRVETHETIRNGLLRLDLRTVYDSERGLEYEGSVGYSIYSLSAGINYDSKIWRVGAGLGLNL